MAMCPIFEPFGSLACCRVKKISDVRYCLYSEVPFNIAYTSTVALDAHTLYAKTGKRTGVRCISGLAGVSASAFS